MIIRYTIYILHYIKYLHGGCLSTGRWYRQHYTHTPLWQRVPFYTIHQKLHTPLLMDYHRLIFMTATTWAMVDWRQPQIMWVVILVTVFIRRHLHWIIFWLWLTSIFTYPHIVIESATVSLYDDNNSHGRHRGFTKSMLLFEIIIAKLYVSS